MEHPLVPDIPAGQRSNTPAEMEPSCCSPIRSKLNTIPIVLLSGTYIVCGVLSIGLGVVACVFGCILNGLSIPVGMFFIATGVVGMLVKKHGGLAIAYGFLNPLSFLLSLTLLISMSFAVVNESTWEETCSSYDCRYGDNYCCDDWTDVLKWKNIAIDVAILVVGVIAMVTSLLATTLSLRNVNWIKVCCLKKNMNGMEPASNATATTDASGQRSASLSGQSAAMKRCWKPCDNRGHRTATIILSVIHIIIGLVSVGLGVAAVFVGCQYAYMGIPIWTGTLIFVVTGIFGLLSVTKKGSYIPCFFALSILAFLLSVNMFSWSSENIWDEGGHEYKYGCTDWSCNTTTTPYYPPYYTRNYPPYYTRNYPPYSTRNYPPYYTRNYPSYHTTTTPYYPPYYTRNYPPYYTRNYPPYSTRNYPPYYTRNYPSYNTTTTPYYPPYYTRNYPSYHTRYYPTHCYDCLPGCCSMGNIATYDPIKVYIDCFIIGFGVLEALICMATFALSFSQLSCYFCCRRSNCFNCSCCQPKPNHQYQMVMTSDGNLMMVAVPNTQHGLSTMVPNQPMMQHQPIVIQPNQLICGQSQAQGSPAMASTHPQGQQGSHPQQPAVIVQGQGQPMVSGQGNPVLVQSQGQPIMVQGQGTQMLAQAHGQQMIVQGQPMMVQAQGQPMLIQGQQPVMVQQSQGKQMMVQGQGQPMMVQPGQGQPMMVQGQGQPMMLQSGQGQPMMVQGQGQPMMLQSGQGQPMFIHQPMVQGMGQVAMIPSQGQPTNQPVAVPVQTQPPKQQDAAPQAQLSSQTQAAGELGVGGEAGVLASGQEAGNVPNPTV